MGNPIQYHNTNNPSQMGGGVATTVAGLLQQPIILNPQGLSQWENCCGMPPPGHSTTEGLMKTLHRYGLS